jgi:hypothetical protein
MRTLVLGFCLFASPLLAQGGTRPDLLRAGVDTFAIYFIQGKDSTLTGAIRDDIRFVQKQGRKVIERIYVTQDRVLGARLDTLIDDARDLSPVSHRSRTSRNMAFVEFSKNQAVGWLRLPNGDSASVAGTIAPGVINSSAFDLWLRAAPLALGWTADVHAFEVVARTTLSLHAKVSGEEIVEGEPSWRVQADFGGTPVTFWIGKTSRSLRRQLMQLSADQAILFTRGSLAAPKRAS